MAEISDADTAVAVAQVHRVEGGEERVGPAARVPCAVGDSPVRLEDEHQAPGVFAEYHRVAGAVDDAADGYGAVTVDHTVEVRQDDGRHQVREPERERARVAGIAGERL